jgi:hypothetical protein
MSELKPLAKCRPWLDPRIVQQVRERAEVLGVNELTAAYETIHVLRATLEVVGLAKPLPMPGPGK